MKICLIGLGYWGLKIKSTLESMGYDLVVVDLNPKLATATFDQVLNDATIQNCLLITPEETHFSLAKKLLAAGKNVLVEKPVCLTVKEGQMLIDLARHRRVNLYADYTFLFDPAVRLIAGLINKKTIGTLYRIESVRHSVNIHKPKISVFDDLAPHDIYLARSFFKAQIRQVEVIKNSYRQFTTSGIVKYELGTHDSFIGYYSWDHPELQRDMTFFGSQGVIEWLKTADGDQVITYKLNHQHQLVKKSEKKVQVKNSPLQLVIKDFLQLNKHEPDSQCQQRYAQYMTDIRVLESIRDQNSPG